MIRIAVSNPWLVVALVMALGAVGPAMAQDATPSIEDRLKKLEDENTELRELLEATRSQLEALRLGDATPPAPGPEDVDIEALLELELASPDAVTVRGDPGMDTRMNPFISFAFDFVADLADVQPEIYDLDGRHSERMLGLREVEIVAQRGVSAYADGFVTFGYHDGHFELEEGYVDINRLVPRTNIRLGRWRTAFGPYNPVHEHQVPFVSFPRTVTNFFGAEGATGDGIEVSYLPHAADFVELRGGVYMNLADEAHVFAHDQGSALSTSAQVRYNRQLDRLTDLDLRLGYLNAPNDDDDGTRTDMWNTAVQWRRDRGNMFSDRVILEWTHMDRDTGIGSVRRNAYSAMYLQQLGLFHEWGLLYENAEFGDPGIRGRVHNYNAFYTWKAQEQQWFRFLYRHGTYPTGPASNELIFQTLWSIGPHSHEFQ